MWRCTAFAAARGRMEHAGDPSSPPTGTRTSTRFAAMLAARRLYPDAVVCLPGALNRNVREFYRLHADELARSTRRAWSSDAIRRLIVVETAAAPRASASWSGSRSTRRSRRSSSTTTPASSAGLGEPESAVVSRGRRADDDARRHPRRARARRDAARGHRVRARDPRGHRLAHLPDGDAARRRGPRLVPSPRRAAGAPGARSSTRRSATTSGSSLGALAELETARRRGRRARDRRSWPRLRRRHLQPRAQDRRASPTPGARPAGRDGRPRVLRHAQPDARGRRRRDRGPPRRGRTHGGRVGDLPRDARRGPRELARRGCRARSASRSRPRRSCRSPPAPSARTRRSRTRSSPASATARAGSSSSTTRSLVGAVGREDLDRAVAHGLSHAPVKGIMSSRVATCVETTPLAELQRLLAAGDDADRRPRGRADRRRRHAQRPAPRARRAGRRRSASRPRASTDRARALERLQPVFEAVAAVAEPFEGVYLVGGTVRDILLGEPSFDVDIAVEGDAIALAQAPGRRARRPRARAREVRHGRRALRRRASGSTSSPRAPSSTTLRPRCRRSSTPRSARTSSAATSRSTRWRSRSRAPTSAGSSTRSAGRRDLEAETIRVLHNLSFIDDPTRIFRAIRYENRYGFRMDEHTLRLARGTIEMGLVGDLSSARLRDELVALLEEGELEHSILRLAELGADRAIHPHLAADDEAVALLPRASGAARPLPARDSRLEARPRRARAAAAAGRGLRVAPAPEGAGAATPSGSPRRSRWARGSSSACASAPSRPRWSRSPTRTRPTRRCSRSRWTTSRRCTRTSSAFASVRLEVSGADLAELGLGESPRVGEVLAELRRRKLNGELDGRDSELAAARELIAG